jgi:hypothetical protein
MFQVLSTFLAREHRPFLKVWLLYVAVLALPFAMLPVTFERNWLDFFVPLRSGYLPYIDFHVGYPPMGFLTYMPFVLLSNFDLMTFTFLMRGIDAFFLIMSVWLIYVIVYKIRGRRDACISASIIMISISTVSYSTHANEPIALFFALLGIYFLLEKKAASTGLAIGLGAMVKLLPGLLILPAIKRLKLTRDGVVLVGVTCTAVLFLNLPFMISSPFMWWGTYSYNGARGPWETVWALIENWYSHGGAEALHPYSEVFIPYSQLATIYQPSSYDHAFYAWNYPWLPALLTILGFGSLLLSYVLINEDDVVEGFALTLFLFIFFSKGYSPQFTIFTLPFVAMAFVGIKKIALCLALEVATILQSIVWLPGLYSSSLLAFAIILRTVTIALIISLLIIHFVKRRQAFNLHGIRLPSIRNLRGKSLAIFIVSVLMVGSSAYFLRDNYSRFPQKVETYEVTRNLELYETTYVPLPDLTENERVMVNLTSGSPITAAVTLGDKEVWASRIPKYTVKEVFVSPESGDYSLDVNMTYPAASRFRIIDETNGDGFGRVEQMGDALNATVVDYGRDGLNSVLRLSWPVDVIVADDFRVKVMLWLFGGDMNRTTLSLTTERGVFQYEVPSNDDWHWFEINSSSVTSDNLGFSDVKGSRIETIDVVFSVNDGGKSGIGIRDLEVRNGGSTDNLGLAIANTSEIVYKIYFVQMYSLSDSPVDYVLYSVLIVGTIMAWVSLYELFKKTKH